MIESPSGTSFVSAIAWVLAATALALLLQRLPHANLSLVYLLAVLIVAAREGFWPSVFASVLSFLVFNFFFTPPLYTLAVHEEGDIATLVFFLAVAAISGSLAARMRGEMTRAQYAVKRTSRLLDFSRRTAASSSAQAAMTNLVETVTQDFRCTALAWVPGEEARLGLRARAGAETVPPSRDVLESAWSAQAFPYRDSHWLLLAIGSGSHPLGLLGVDRASIGAEEEDLLVGLCEQTAVAVERVVMARDLDEARVASETERFRTALLSSVSHDLRTPLATIIGSVTSLQELWPNLSAETRRELLQTVVDESNRLDRYIQNLLDMTRLGHGTPLLRRGWVDLNDVVANAIRRLDTVLGHLRLVVDIEQAAALMHVHGDFIEQVIVNLLDNAASFSPDDGQVSLTARRRGGDIVIEVVDEGPGIPETEFEKIFEMFYASKTRERSHQGSGLGLAICRGLVGAHGGDIRAVLPRGGSGACIRVTLPVAEGEQPVTSAESEP